MLRKISEKAKQEIKDLNLQIEMIHERNKAVLADLKESEGKYVKLNYVERYRTFSWWGETRYFVTSVKKETSPFNQK